MAKDILMTKGTSIVSINSLNLEKFLELGYVQDNSGYVDEVKTKKKVAIKSKEDKKELNDTYINTDYKE